MSDHHPIQKFLGYPRERWDKLKADMASKTGIAITTDAGEASAHGISVKWSYDEKEGSVTIQTLKTPFLVPESVVNQKIHDEVENI